MVDYSTWKVTDLINEINRLKSQKKYGLVWEDEPETVSLNAKENYPVIREVTDRRIESDTNNPTNLIIEGDNYDALRVLSYTHKGKVDVIYIDPPYNTGNTDFKYNDKYVDKEDSYRHSKWLSFMNKRLTLTKSLLAEKGLILISIGNDEFAQLKLLCDTIYGETSEQYLLYRVSL